MALFSEAVAITLRNEGQFAFNQVSGEIVNFGVTGDFLADKHLLPSDAAASLSLYKTTHNPEDAAAIVAFMEAFTEDQAIDVYHEFFWLPIRGDDILDQTLANKVFDVDVNQGGIAVEELQEAVNDLELGGGKIQVDGRVGPLTIAAVNALPPSNLLTQFRYRVEARYRAIAAANPKLAGDLAGWLARLAS